LEKIHPGENCANCICEKKYEQKSDPYCYQWACYQTADLLAKRLQIAPEKYTVSFQSRLDKNWMSPFTDKVLMERAAKGDKRILVFCPAFVADCLETTIEIEDEYKEMFLEAGGERLDLVESLNAHPHWVEAVRGLVLKN
jgi:ferrochelatase